MKQKTNPKCHPSRVHQAKGLCKNCYMSQWKIKKRRALGIKARNKPIDSFIVYLYYDLVKGPIYVGEGTLDRALSHKYSYKNSTWWNKDLLLVTMTCKDEWEALEYEGKWGGHYHPSGNVWGNRKFRPRRMKKEEEGAS